MMEQKARQAVLAAVDQGWRGPPFDPIELAHIMGMSVRPNAALADARVFWANGGYEIELQPAQASRPREFLDCARVSAHVLSGLRGRGEKPKPREVGRA